MFSVQNMEELGRLYESDTPVLAYDFKRRMVEGWTPEHSHHRGQLVALTQGLLIVETENERWLFPSQRCAWTQPNCKPAAHSVGGAAGSMVDLSAEMCRGLPETPNLRPYGLKASFGITINYRYMPDELEENHERFVTGGQIRISDTLSREQAAVKKGWHQDKN
jgi:hypothetical protein